MSGDMMPKAANVAPVNRVTPEANQASGVPQEPIRGVGAESVNFDGASSVISSAQKFIIPIPNLGEMGEALVFPQGHSKAGEPILDYQGKPIGDRGLVFFNHKDQSWQAVPGDGNGVIIINEVSREGATALLCKMREVGGEMAELTGAQIKDLLEFAHHELQLKDMYNSDKGFIVAKMTPVEESLAPGGFGFMKRDDRDVCQAVYMPGRFTFDGPAITPQVFEDGGIILKQGAAVRGLQPDVFQRTYRHANGTPIESLAEIKTV